ncbi:hypothetical protein LZ30DRAFT_775654 [Colletotrichum cereale]|nr:hypothetical protein LZ30DRAFT_775654 [Colletotrichum cereale]
MRPGLSILFSLLAACRIMAVPSGRSTDLIPRRSRLVTNPYRRSCPDVRMIDPGPLVSETLKETAPYLVARCKGFGRERCSWIPLQACFANTNGQITYTKYGAFDQSCSSCEYEASDAEMRCMCYSPEDKKKIIAKIRLEAAGCIVKAFWASK